jgi:protein translocase SecG subunit
MTAVIGVLPYIQIVLSALVVVCVLLQRTGASMGGAFGGDNFSATYHTRRGAEKALFYATVICGFLLAAASFASFLLQ